MRSVCRPFFFSCRRRHTRCSRDWSSDVCSSDLTLDDLSQLLFLFDHFDEICGADASPPYLSKWQTKWGAIEGMRDYFNKITEELVDPDALAGSASSFVQQVGATYKKYRVALFRNNRVDFAHQQKIDHDLLL